MDSRRSATRCQYDGGWSASLRAPRQAGPLFSGPSRCGSTIPSERCGCCSNRRASSASSTQDLTGRVLDGLGRVGLTTLAGRSGARSSSCALSSSTTAGSGAVDRQLPGLDGVRAPGTRARRRRHVRTWVRRAVGFVLARQNSDGGWGELPDSTGTRRWPAAARACRRSPASCDRVDRTPGEGSSEAVVRGTHTSRPPARRRHLAARGLAPGDRPAGHLYILAERPSSTRSRRSPAGSRAPIHRLGTNPRDSERSPRRSATPGRELGAATASHMRSVSNACCPMNSQAEA